MDNLIGYLISAGAVISLLAQLLKRISFPLNDKPKFLVTIIAVILVVGVFIYNKSFDVANLDLMVTEIAGIVVSSVAFYEIVVKPIVSIFKKK